MKTDKSRHKKSSEAIKHAYAMSIGLVEEGIADGKYTSRLPRTPIGVLTSNYNLNYDNIDLCMSDFLRRFYDNAI